MPEASLFAYLVCVQDDRVDRLSAAAKVGKNDQRQQEADDQQSRLLDETRPREVGASLSVRRNQRSRGGEQRDQPTRQDDQQQNVYELPGKRRLLAFLPSDFWFPEFKIYFRNIPDMYA